MCRILVFDDSSESFSERDRWHIYKLNKKKFYVADYQVIDPAEKYIFCNERYPWVILNIGSLNVFSWIRYRICHTEYVNQVLVILTIFCVIKIIDRNKRTLQTHVNSCKLKWVLERLDELLCSDWYSFSLELIYKAGTLFLLVYEVWFSWVETSFKVRYFCFHCRQEVNFCLQ